MSLLDGKYEVMKQQQTDSDCTVFEAAAPDGTLLRIEWYDLAPEREDEFERYRRTLKRLKRTGRTAVYDVTSRPGARYVAWRKPPENAGRGHDPELEGLLEAQGFSREDALLLKDAGQPKLFGLAFGSVARTFATRETAAPPEPSAGWWRRLPRLPPRGASWLITGALLIASLGLTAIGFERRANDRIAEVPDLTGEPINAAAAQLHAAGFAITVSPRSSDAAPGTVLSIEPGPGTELRPGRTVHVSYALPSGQLPSTEVPRLVGEAFPGGVTARLDAAGLRLGHVARIAADVPPGAVIAQSALPGAELGRGETVDILVSDGPSRDETFVPDLVGLDIEDARYLAGIAGFSTDRILQETVVSSGAANEVLSQSLAPHRPVAREDAVLRLIVSGGGGYAAVSDATPSFVGLDRAQALAAIGGATLVDITAVEALSLPEGVIDQEPAPGEPPSARIRLTLNVHPLPIPLPEVQARVREPELHAIPFSWAIEPGIPQVTATVYATTLEGERKMVHSERVAGGETVDGAWVTNYPGVVTFHLELNGQPYSSPLRVVP